MQIVGGAKRITSTANGGGKEGHGLKPKGTGGTRARSVGTKVGVTQLWGRGGETGKRRCEHQTGSFGWSHLGRSTRVKNKGGTRFLLQEGSLVLPGGRGLGKERLGGGSRLVRSQPEGYSIRPGEKWDNWAMLWGKGESPSIWG